MSKDTKKTAGGNKPAKASKSAAPKAAPKKSAPKQAAPAKAAQRPAAVQKKPAAKPSASAPRKPKQPTTISVQANIGFGNQLFIRGEGPGLSWDRGVPMECQGADQWHWSVNGASRPFAFKLLINDQLWSHGENEAARPGEKIVVQPAF